MSSGAGESTRSLSLLLYIPTLILMIAYDSLDSNWTGSKLVCPCTSGAARTKFLGSAQFQENGQSKGSFAHNFLTKVVANFSLSASSVRPQKAVELQPTNDFSYPSQANVDWCYPMLSFANATYLYEYWRGNRVNFCLVPHRALLQGLADFASDSAESRHHEARYKVILEKSSCLSFDYLLF